MTQCVLRRVEVMPHGRVISDRSRRPPAASERPLHRRRLSLPPSSLPSAFLRVLLVRPSVDVVVRCPHPTDRGPLRRDGATRRACAVRGFSPLRQLAPPIDFRACCVPVPTLGFIGLEPCGFATARPSPMPGPPEPSPPSQRFPTSPWGPAPLAFPDPRVAGGTFEASFRFGVRCACVPLPVRRARCSPGLPCPGAACRLATTAPSAPLRHRLAGASRCVEACRSPDHTVRARPVCAPPTRPFGPIAHPVPRAGGVRLRPNCGSAALLSWRSLASSGDRWSPRRPPRVTAWRPVVHRRRALIGPRSSRRTP